MSKKISWKMIYRDFRKRHPSLSKDIVYYCPRDFLTIDVWLADGTKMSYDYFTKRVVILSEKWKKHFL